MARTVNALRGLTSGAATGASVGSIIPGVGTTIGAVVGGGLGLIAGLGSQSDEEVRQQRINDLIKKYNAMKADEQKALDVQTQKNVGKVNAFATGQNAQANAGIARRAASMGVGGDNEATILSSTNNINNRASGSLQDIISSADQAKLNIDSKYNGLIANAEYDMASSPIEPNAVDVIDTIAGPAMQFAQNKQYMDTLKNLGGGTVAPKLDILPKPSGGVETVQPGGGTGTLMSGTGPTPSNVLSLSEIGSLIPKRKYNGRVNAMVN